MSKEKRTFFANTVHTLVTKVFIAGLKLALSVLTARTLGVSGRGLFFLSTSLAGTTSTVGSFSIGEGLTFLIAKGSLKRKEIFGTASALLILFTLFLWIVIYCLIPFLMDNILSELDADLVPFIFLLIPFLLIEYLFGQILKGLEKFKLLNYLSIFTRSIIIVSLLGFVFTQPVTFSNFFKAYVFVLGAIATIQMLILWYLSYFRISLNIQAIKEIFKFGFSVHLGIMMTEIEHRLDVFILAFFLSASAIGIYSIAVVMAQLLWYSSNALNSVLFPYLASRLSEKIKNITFTIQVTKLILLLNTFLILMLIIFGEFIIFILYGEEFILAYSVFLFLSIGLLGESISRTLSVWIKSNLNPIILSKIALVTLSVNIGLNFLLIPLYGIYGAALASSASYLLRALLLMIVFKKNTGTNLLLFFRFKFEDFRVFKNFLKESKNEN